MSRPPRKNIYFIRKNGEKITFPEFIQQERARLNMTYRELEVYTGVENLCSYTCRNSGGKSNNPPSQKFSRIIKALGYTEKDFLVEGKLCEEYGHREITDETLRQVGNSLLGTNKEREEKGQRKQKFSSTAIRKIAGEAVGAKYCMMSHEERIKSYERMKGLNPEYEQIAFQNQIQHKGETQRLKKFEEDIISQSIIEYLDKRGKPDYQRLPPGTLGYITKKLNAARKEKGLKERSIHSIRYQVNEIWNPQEKPKEFMRGSPQATSLEEITLAKTEELGEILDENEEGQLEKITGRNKQERSKSTTQIIRNGYLSQGHQKILAYLIDPENYKKILGEDINLLCVDLREDETNPELFEAFKGKLESLEGKLQEDTLGSLIDGWLRMDLLFKRRNGTYGIVEVKQRAINRVDNEKVNRIRKDSSKPEIKKIIKKDKESELSLVEFSKEDKKQLSDARRNDNATKAFKQIWGYSGMISGAVAIEEFENKDNPDYVALKKPVEATLVAYEVQEDLYDFLNSPSNPNFNVKIVSRLEVNKYIERIIGKPKEVVEKASEKATESKDGKTSFKRVSVNPATKEVAQDIEQRLYEERITSKEHIQREIQKRQSIRNIEEFQKRETNFSIIESEIKGATNGIQIGKYNPKSNLLELNGKLYQINGSKRHLKQVREWVEKNIISEGKINKKKYPNNEIIHI